MDPNTNLLRLMELAAKDWSGKSTEELSPDELCQLHNDHEEMSDLLMGLDSWIRTGGFLPDQWRKSR